MREGKRKGWDMFLHWIEYSKHRKYFPPVKCRPVNRVGKGSGWKIYKLDKTVCQELKSCLGGARQLTFWKGCHGRTSGIQFEARRRTKLTSWKGCHGCTSWIQMETRSPSKLGDSFLCRQFEITNLTCLLPISYIQNFPSFHIENITFFPLSFAIISIMSQKMLDLTPTYWISWLNFVTDIQSWYLHPEISVVAVFTIKDKGGLSHVSSRLQSQLQKMYSTYIPYNNNVWTKSR